MKKIIVLALGVALIASLSFAQSNVLSRNAVGYTKGTAPKGAFALYRSDFFNMAGPATPSNVFGLTQFPTGTVMYLWDRVNQSYIFETLSLNAKGVTMWGPGTNLVDPGDAFWVKVPGTAASNEYQFYIMGEVPDKTTAPTSSATMRPGFNMFGYPYPADILWTNTVLAKGANTNDALWTYGDSGYSFNIYGLDAKGKLVWSQPTQVLYVGKGYWFRRGSSYPDLDWQEPKPYTWP